MTIPTASIRQYILDGWKKITAYATITDRITLAIYYRWAYGQTQCIGIFQRVKKKFTTYATITDGIISSA